MVHFFPPVVFMRSFPPRMIMRSSPLLLKGELQLMIVNLFNDCFDMSDHKLEYAKS